MELSNYIQLFKKLRLHRTNGKVSPHKVCMLYAVIDLIEEGSIQWNVIYFDEKLKRRYLWHFERFRSGNDKPNPCYPFFHLTSDGFWHLNAHPGQQERLNAKPQPSISDKFLSETISHAYFDQPLFELMRDKSFCVMMKQALAENIDDNSDHFKQWCLSIGKSEKTVKNYIGALKTTIPQIAGYSERSCLQVRDYLEIKALYKKCEQLPEFIDRNTRGNGMYSAALRLYLNYLDELMRISIEHDVTAIQTDNNLASTQKETLIQARRGQGKFRERLINQWGKCAVTGYENLSLLVASHIKPWSQSSNEERLDPFNGLLLIPNLDRAFDLNYISFSDRGKILISDQLENYDVLGVHPDMKISVKQEHQDFLAYHRDKFRGM